MKWVVLALCFILSQVLVSTASVNPYIDTEEYPFHNYAIGIASYGVYQKGGSLIPYSIETNSVIGYLNLREVQITSPFSIQLNVMMLSSGETYWLQDVVVINPEGNFYLTASMLNLTSIGSPLHVQGNGEFLQAEDGECYYVNYVGDFKYHLPLSLILVVNVTHENNEVRVLYGVRGVEGSCLDGRTYYFGNFVLRTPNVSNAFIYVSGYNYLKDSSPYQGFTFYDAELVFGGEGNGKVVTFNKLVAFLSLYYQHDGKYVAFPSFFDFGSNTAEGTSNLKTIRIGNAFEITTGNQEYYYLGRDSGSIQMYWGKVIVLTKLSGVNDIFLSISLFLLILAYLFKKILSLI
jgi:thermopsin